MEKLLAIHGNDVYFGPDYIGSVCRKPQGHWTAYLATENGDEVVGQYPTKLAAGKAVDDAYGQQVATEVLGYFEVEI